MQPIRIAFGHKARSGKDTAGEYLQQKYGGEICKFAGPLYTVCTYIQRQVGTPVQKDPRLLQTVGGVMRVVYGDDIFARLLTRSMPTDLDVYVTDFRHKSEVAELRRLGFTLVKIDRADRPIDRDPTHLSEVDLDDFEGWDFVVKNDGTVADLHAKLDGIVKHIHTRELGGR